MKPCPSFPGYSASADGAIWSSRRRKRPHRLREYEGPKGYLVVSVATSTGCRPVGVHQLVADAFLGGRPSVQHQVRHLDGNPANNCASNLAWGTAAENAADRLRHGRYERGARHPNARLTEQKVRELLERRSAGEKVRDLAKAYGVGVATVEGILYGKAWKHVPREFKRVEAKQEAA
jgi:hypothetical protein